MKKSRDDKFNAYVNYYLEKRNYLFNHQHKMANFKERRKKKGLSLEEMVTSTIVDNCSPISPINGRLINGDDNSFVELVHESFSRLIHFINDSKIYRSALKQLLFPCLIKFFVQLMVNGHTEGAKTLLVKYESQFTEESQVNLINFCHSSLMVNQVDSILTKYASSKQSLLLTVDCHSYLFEFLNSLKDLTLLNECIPRYFDILTTHNSNLPANDLKSPNHHLAHKSLSSSSSATSTSTKNTKSTANNTRSRLNLTNHNSSETINSNTRNNNNSLTKVYVNHNKAHPSSNSSSYEALQHSPSSLSSTPSPTQEEDNLDKAFEQLSKLPPCIPGSCIGYLEGCNPCTVDIRNDTKYFAAGFDNSEINLWSLTALGLKTQKSYVNQHQSNLSNPLKLALSPDHGTSENSDDTSPVHRRSVTTSLTGDKTLSGASILRGHYGSIYGLSFVQNSPYLISCSEDTTARLWDLNNCKNIFVYTGHLYPVWCIDSSPLELYFVTGSRDTTARLWTFERLYPLRIFVGHIMDVDVVKFHPNASYIASGSSDKTIRLWEVNNGQMVRLFEGHKAGITSLAFSPDGKFLVSGSDDCLIKIWDLRASKGPLSTISSHKATVNDVCFNGDGSVLISGSSEKTVKFWDFKQIKENNDNSEFLLYSIQTDYSLIKLKMLPHNVIYIHGHKA